MTEPARGGRRAKRGYHHGALKDALVAAAREILEEDGPRALTLREAARRAGVSHAAPAHHFRNVGEFLAEIGARGFDDLTAALDEAAVAGGESDAGERLVAMGCAYVRFALSQRAVFRLMFARDSFAAPTQALEESGRRAYGRLERTVREVYSDLAEPDLAARVAAAWSLVHGHANLLIEEQICADVSTQAEIDARVAAAGRALMVGWRALDAAKA